MSINLFVAVISIHSVILGFTSQQLETIYKKVSPSVALIQYSSEVMNQITGEVSRRDGNALGLIVSSDGLVMVPGFVETENIESFNFRVRIQINNEEKEFNATKLKKPDDINVLFLKIENKEGIKFPFVLFANDPQLRVGSAIAMVGVLGETLDNVRCITTAHIGAILEKPRLTYCIDENVRLGFVGAPVINEQGDVVGVIGFDLSKAEGGEVYTRSGHPLVYQYELFKKYLEEPPKIQLKEDEQEAWLGVITQPLTDDFAEYWGLPKEGGLIVATVVNPSPASECGLKVGDIITNFNGVPIHAKYDSDVTGFTKLVREAGAGNHVKIEILRDGTPMTLTALLSNRPRRSYEAEEYEWESVGLTIREITPDLRIALSIDESVQGVFVYRVKSGSPAQVARLARGFIIQSIGNYPISSIKEFKELAKVIDERKPKEITVFAKIGNISGFFRIQPRWGESE
ncbi:MAG TPA: PDZ domain-containing protein [Candidatus Hydrogenedens sp.]|nr:PDZ domain-containing protein [Candidatus Hydrogenedens sp.]HPP57941.1 PDZ domain-containing protein [Candidatus Hydrogenedens sp.]